MSKDIKNLRGRSAHTIAMFKHFYCIFRKYMFTYEFINFEARNLTSSLTIICNYPDEIYMIYIYML
jgi:hypothetical protein